MNSNVIVILAFIAFCLFCIFIFFLISKKLNGCTSPKVVGDLIVCRTEKGDPYYFMQISDKDHFKIPKMKEVTLRVVDHGELTI